MAQKLSKADLPNLQSWLQHHLPRSFKVYQDLKSHLEGKFPDLDFFVDKWPSPGAVCMVLNCEDDLPDWKCFYSDKVLGLFGETDESVTVLLKDPSVVDWEKYKMFAAVPDCLWPVVRKVADDMGKSLTQFSDYLLKATPDDLKPIRPVPEGMKISCITDDDVGIVDATWPFKTEGSRAYIQRLIHAHPSVFMTTDDGQHVGHMLGQSYGAIGMLYVNPEFRGRGCAKVIISQLAKQYFDNGEDGYVIIVDNNPVSVSLHQSVGFKMLPDLKLGFFVIHPKNLT